MSGRPPSPAVVYGVIAFAELVVAAAALWVTGWWWRTTGPGAQYGLASRHEIRALLGQRPLLRRRTTIRPDLNTGKR